MKLMPPSQWREKRAVPHSHSWNTKRAAMGRSGSVEEDMFDFSSHWMYAFLGTAVGFVTLVAISIYVIIKRRRKASSPLTPEPPKQASVQCPPITIALQTAQQQQPVSQFERISPQPIRVKARGLLERRGSNASLTIDLNQSDSSFQCGSPPKECSAEEYLTSAGNRMTRRQLRTCLKDSKILQQEFLDIPLNHPGKLDLPGCSNKNRYKSIWPNEHTRVILPERNGDHSTTYINANYVRVNTGINCTKDHIQSTCRCVKHGYFQGYDGESRAFIATQGPLHHTINDFWLAVWNENVPCIVMMTKLREKNKIKCEPYLPTREAQYGLIHVTVRITTAKNGYFVRELILQKDNEMRQLKHYWFTGWPDHKAPASTCCQLLDLAQEVLAEKHKQESKLPGPIIAHCRGGMIQTPEQYEFLHRALMLYEKELPETPTSAPLPLTSSNSSTSSKNTSPSS